MDRRGVSLPSMQQVSVAETTRTETLGLSLPTAHAVRASSAVPSGAATCACGFSVRGLAGVPLTIPDATRAGPELGWQGIRVRRIAPQHFGQLIIARFSDLLRRPLRAASTVSIWARDPLLPSYRSGAAGDASIRPIFSDRVERIDRHRRVQGSVGVSVDS